MEYVSRCILCGEKAIYGPTEAADSHAVYVRERLWPERRFKWTVIGAIHPSCAARNDIDIPAW